MADVKIKRLMETDEKKVKRQIYPVTHVSAIDGLNELNSSLSDVKSINGKSGNVTITLADLGISIEMFDKLSQIIEEFDNGTLGNGNIELEKIEEE